MLLCIASMVFRGFNFGIDFAGGNSFRLPGSDASSWSTSGQAAEDAGAEVASAQIVGGNTILLRTARAGQRRASAPWSRRSPTPPASSRSEVSPEAVSAEWGNDITDQALIALAVFLVAVVLFLARPVPAEDGDRRDRRPACTTSS